VIRRDGLISTYDDCNGRPESQLFLNDPQTRSLLFDCNLGWWHGVEVRPHQRSSTPILERFAFA
jgi:hypothetical protein